MSGILLTGDFVNVEMDHNCFYSTTVGTVHYRIDGDNCTAAEVWGNTGNATGKGWGEGGRGWAEGDIAADPLFTNTATGDLTLQSGSPCRDVADSTLGSPYNLALHPSSKWPNGVATVSQDNYDAGWEMGAFVYDDELGIGARWPRCGRWDKWG